MDSVEYDMSFNSIKTKKEYIDLRLKLENSFIMFFAYEVGSEENESWNEILKELQNKFQEKLKVYLFSNKSEQKLLDVLKKDDEDEIIYPRMVLCHPHLTEPQLYCDLTPYDTFKIVEDASNFYISDFNAEKEKMFEKIKKILDSYPVVVFIKGSPHDPFCKFSKSFINVLKQTGIKYRSFDIFRDEALRSYLRLYSGWKTYPQFYINGKIIGGVDVLTDLVNKGEFMNMVPTSCKKEGVLELIENLVKENKIVVFGKGSIENPKCKASTEAYDILNKRNIQFKLVDVLKDEMMRDLVKTHYKYEFFPMIIKNGKLFGGIKDLRKINTDEKISKLN